MGKPRPDRHPDERFGPPCVFCAERHHETAPGQLCADCRALAESGHLFFFGALVGPDAAQTRHGLPERDPAYRMRRLTKIASRQLGVRLQFGRVPPVIPLTPVALEADE